jgi:putative membrane protein
MNARMAVLAALVALSSCSPNAEQEAHPRRASGSLPAPVLAPQDRDFLERAAEGSNAEIAMGKLVETHTSNAAVQAYGRRMVRDHGAINARLSALAARYGVALPTSLGEHQAGFDRLVDLRRDEFDQEFLQVMNEDHDQARQLFQDAAAGGFDPSLKAFAAQTQPTIDAHLTHAKAMADGIAPTY